MSDSLSWEFRLVEKVSGPARKAEAATSDFEKELKKVNAELKRIEHNPAQFKELKNAKRELSELRGGTKSWAERFEEVGANVRKIGFVQNAMLFAEGLHLAYEAAEKVVDAGFDIAKDMLKAAGEAERFKVSFEALLGADAGQEITEHIEHIEKATEASNTELKRMSSHLLTVGFNAEELKQILPAAFDIAGFLGGGVEKADAAADALARIKTTGEISKRSLGALGLEYGKVLDQLKSETGLSVEELKKKMGDGKFGPQVLHAVLQSIADKEGGKLGTTAEKMAATVDSKLKKLKEIPDKFFEGLVNSKGFSKFEEFLSKLVEELSPESEFGQQVMKGLTGLFDDIFGSISGRGDDMTSVIKEAILASIDAARDMVPVVKEVAGDILDIVNGIAEGIRGLRLLHAIQTGNKKEAAEIFRQEYERRQEKIDRAEAKVAKEAGYGTGQRGVLSNEVGAGSVLRDMPRGPEVSEIAIPSQAARVAPGSARATSQTAHVHPGAIQINVGPGANVDEISNAVATTLPGAMQQGFERMNP